MIELNSPGLCKPCFDFEAVESGQLVDRFETSREQALHLLRVFEVRRRKTMGSATEISELLVKTMENCAEKSAEAAFKFHRFFNQFRVAVDLSALEGTARPPHPFDHRSANDLPRADFMSVTDALYVGMRGFNSQMERFQNRVIQEIGNELMKDNLRGAEIQVSQLFKQARAAHATAEREAEELVKHYEELSTTFVTNNKASMYRTRLDRPSGSAKDLTKDAARNTFPKVSTYFARVKGVLSTFRIYFSAVIELVEGVRSLDGQRMAAIKSGIQLFAEAFKISFQLPIDQSIFSVTEYLVEGLDIAKLISFKFDLSGLLPTGVQEALSASTGDKELTLDTLRKFFERIRVEGSHSILNLLIADKVCCLMGDIGEVPVQAVLYLTTEHTLVVYKVDTAKKELQLIDTLLLENVRLIHTPNYSTFELEYQEKRTFFDKKRKFAFIFEPVAFEHLSEGLEVLRRLMAEHRLGKPFPITSSRFVRAPEASKDEMTGLEASTLTLTPLEVDCGISRIGDATSLGEGGSLEGEKGEGDTTADVKSGELLRDVNV
jgi:hypothetical protein